MQVMQQHAVPQPITAFQFKLVGSLTLRQFIYLATGGLLAFIFWKSPLPLILRFPTAVIFAFFGLTAAFIPVQGRSFDKWLVAFFKAVFSPTQRIWKKTPHYPEFLTRVGVAKVGNGTPVAKPPPKKLIQEYFKARPEPAELTPQDLAEKNFLESLNFSISLPATAVKPAVKPVKIPQVKPAEILPGIEEKKKLVAKPALAPLASEVNFYVKPVIQIATPAKTTQFIPAIGEIRVRKLHSLPSKLDLEKIPIRGERRFEISDELKRRLGLIEEEEIKIEEGFAQIIPQPIPQPPPAPAAAEEKLEPAPPPAAKIPEYKPIPTVQPVKVTPLRPQVPIPEVTPPEIATKTTIPAPEVILQPVPSKAGPETKPAPTAGGEKPKLQVSTKPRGKTQAKFVAVAVVPKVSVIPNILSGVVKDNTGKLIENAILIVKDSTGIPVRALKTNRLGQFSISTPLKSGNHTIELEKEGLDFDIIEFATSGKVLPPVEIQAKNAAN